MVGTGMVIVYRLLAVTLLVTRVIIIYDNYKKIKDRKRFKKYEDDPDA